MEGSMSDEYPASKSYRDLPEWQKAHADYLAGPDGDSETVLDRRLRAAYRLWEIERDWDAQR